MKTSHYLVAILFLSACVDDGDFLRDRLNTWEQFEENDGLVDDQVTVVFEDKDQNIWIGTTGGLSMYDHDDFTNYTTQDGLLSNYVTAIAEDDEGNIWVGTPEGLNILIDDEWLYFVTFDGTYISSLLAEEDDEYMLIGTDCCGVVEYEFDDNTISTFYYSQSCDPCNIVYSLFQSSDGSVWIGSEAGVRRIRNGNVTTFGVAQGLSGNIVTAIAEDRWENIWIGTFDGYTLSKIDGNDVTEVGLVNFNAQNWVWNIIVDRKGVVWISTATEGLYRYDGAYMRREFDNLSDDHVSALLQDSRGDVWIGTLYEGLFRYVPD